jgi:hypothetical protein
MVVSMSEGLGWDTYVLAFEFKFSALNIIRTWVEQFCQYEEQRCGCHVQNAETFSNSFRCSGGIQSTVASFTIALAISSSVT